MGVREVWSFVKTLFISHLFLTGIFVISGLIVNFLQFVTYLCLWPRNKALYRKIVCNLAYSHWCQMVFIGQWWSGSDCTVHFEDPTVVSKYIGKEHTIVIMNHKYDIDWLMTWIIAERCGLLGGTKVYGKSSLRFVPLIGWAWIFVETIFLYRNWDKDKDIITAGVKELTEYPENYWVTLLLFPEGTRFTEQKHQQSMEIAKAKGMPVLKHHLLPRSKGFVQTIFAMKDCEKKISAIYDLTVGFRSDGVAPTLMNILHGKPAKAEIFARRIPIEDVPTDSEENCSEWLQDLFRKKDQVYDNFVQNGQFTIGEKTHIPVRWNDFLISMFWILAIGLPFFKYIFGLLLSGSLTTIVATVVLLLIFSLGVRMLIGVSEIKQGSEYGNKAGNNNKKEQ